MPRLLFSFRSRESDVAGGRPRAGTLLNREAIPISKEAKLEISREASSADARAVREGLFAYNRAQAGEQRFQVVNLFLRDGSGKLAGGLLASILWNWLAIEYLWISEEWRGLGYGKHLVLAAEKEALGNVCQHACLDTFSFQAKGFYERLGYSVYGVLDDFPGEHKRYFLRKDLRP